MNSKNLHCKTIVSALLTSLLLLSCASVEEASVPGPEDADKLLVVDCLLPPQVRKLGSNFSYAAARRPVKTSAAECEIRGGEYVAYDRADYRTALKVWLPQAEAGDPQAQNYVGQIYEKGLGLAADYVTAAHWYTLAAEQDYSEAQINLGYLYEKGLGVEQNNVTALNWYRRASGIKDDSLQFASTVEIARVSQQQLASLQQQLAAEKQKTENYKQELKTVKAEIDQLNQDMQLAQAQTRNKELELQLAQSNQSGPEEMRRLQKEIDQARQELQKRETALKQYQNKEQDLEQQLQSAQVKLASSELNQGRMSINVIEPMMSITRGVRGTVLEKSTREKEIFGKINTPAGIKNLTINGDQYELDEFNMFWAKVPITGNVTPVEIIATDKLGQKVDFSFSLFADKDTQQRENLKNINIDFGTYHALIIGNNSYRNLPELKTAVSDAEAISDLLQNRYGFKTKLLLNANYYQILASLDELRRTLTEKDNLLIYYAGHGEIDAASEQGYWLPVDAETFNQKNWISNEAITGIIDALPAKHVMVIADSCYSGTLGQGNLSDMALDIEVNLDLDWVKAMGEVRTRTVLTSGGDKPVLDIGLGQHSIFADALLSVLESNEGLLEGYRLHREVLQKMRANLARVNQNQIPEYSPIKHAGHEGGEFFLQPTRT